MSKFKAIFDQHEEIKPVEVKQSKNRGNVVIQTMSRYQLIFGRILIRMSKLPYYSKRKVRIFLI